MTGISQSKTKKVSDVGALMDLTNKLASLEIRQNKIYGKFSTLHKKMTKDKKLDRIDTELQALDAVVLGRLTLRFKTAFARSRTRALARFSRRRKSWPLSSTRS